MWSREWSCRMVWNSEIIGFFGVSFQWVLDEPTSDAGDGDVSICIPIEGI